MSEEAKTPETISTPKDEKTTAPQEATTEKTPTPEQTTEKEPKKETLISGNDANSSTQKQTENEESKKGSAPKEEEAPAKEDDISHGGLFSVEQNEGQEETLEDLEAQMWRTAWKNKYMSFEQEEEEPDKPFAFAFCQPTSIKINKTPPYVTMKLESGTKLTNSANGISMDYKGHPTFQDALTMVRLGAEKGWKAAKIDPDTSPEFQEQMYLAMCAMGMKVTNFEQLNLPDSIKEEGEKMAEAFKADRQRAESIDKRYADLDAARKKAMPDMTEAKAFEKLDAEKYKEIATKVKDMSPEKEAPTQEQPASDKPKETPTQEQPASDKPKEAPTQEQPMSDKPKEAKTQEQPMSDKPKEAKTQVVAPAEKTETLSQSMQSVMGEMAKAAGVNLESQDSKEAAKAAAKIGKSLKTLPQELQGKFGKLVNDVIENHPDVAKQLIVDLNSLDKQGPARLVKAYSKAKNSIREAEAKGQKTTTHQTEKQKQAMANKIMSGIKKNARD